MPSLSELPSNLSRKSLTKALERLGFSISTKGGKGSHIKATHRNQKSITIPSSNPC
jgi:predicted RNA binding protein YcfA (HicA-like mRNA interferase family)